VAKKKWIRGAIGKPGRLHRYFGVAADKDIPVARINAKIASLQAKAKGDKTLSKQERSLLRALLLARRLRGFSKKG